ncbi:MAG: undecaprenyldiphospho-muramoylpentapeptide beta-N-acetylglucosaminyltransferase [Humidesulfovibrio sp.]|uniref:undecaprenyldiphospho-muramoylpentapeptide beta-N-acetylglucosaminyltransferase n=1 Tax=Humidesulfovibrio sp. TaxID=2910988 RepID=UPI0027F23E64|nr:undecaprenyldiphospho-muramoylpentapeptide beta-N-acetylglucosaminyltransferase [Humidesulfovibrio sp.]MDQ7834599.1 undecaprenyldiphospho-muramoylpentapeptide beta-N-acetylglucosaminyltransferase [Humidesulfovibrio sp.]
MSTAQHISRLVVTTGGTGGHIFPALSVAAEVRRRTPEARVLFLGGNGPEGELARKAGLSFEALPASGVLGKGVKALLATVWVGKSVILATRALRRFQPQAVIGFGGYAGFCPVLAAALLGIPSAVHEQNSVAGVTNRILGKLVGKVFVSFEDRHKNFPASKVLRTGNPVRAEIASVDRTPGAGRNLLVLGGSQGAKPLNDLVVAALPQLMAARVNILHQAGKADVERIRAAYRAAGADDSQVQGFVEDMAGAYAWADLALCRAGASTIFELAATGTPSVLVPFPFAAHDHQRVNAKALEALGAAILADQKRLDGTTLAILVLGLLGDAARLGSMGRAAKDFARPDAASAIVDGLEKLCRQAAR